MEASQLEVIISMLQTAFAEAAAESDTTRVTAGAHDTHALMSRTSSC